MSLVLCFCIFKSGVFLNLMFRETGKPPHILFFHVISLFPCSVEYLILSLLVLPLYFVNFFHYQIGGNLSFVIPLGCWKNNRFLALKAFDLLRVYAICFSLKKGKEIIFCYYLFICNYFLGKNIYFCDFLNKIIIKLSTKKVMRECILLSKFLPCTLFLVFKFFFPWNRFHGPIILQ